MHDGTRTANPALETLRLGRLAGATADGRHLIDTPDGEVAARSLVPIRPADRGREVAFACTPAGEAVILGLVQPPKADATEADEVRIDSPRRLHLTCGKASITLYPDGRVVIRGTQILSRAEGANRIVGGSVHLN